MIADIEFLTIFAEIYLGMTAFFAIVATLRQTLGEALTPYQYLITRYFLEAGLLTTAVTIAALGVAATQQDDFLGWQALAWMLAIGSIVWQASYLSRRRALRPPPPSSKTAAILMVSVSVLWLNLVLVLSGINPMSIATAATALLVTNLAGSIAVFLIFVGSFMKINEVEPID
ncbi:MAG: hypothetical protein V7742_09700 [Halioglobus sp.]